MGIVEDLAGRAGLDDAALPENVNGVGDSPGELHGVGNHNHRETVARQVGHDGWDPIRAYWQTPSQANREALHAFLTPEATLRQYTHGVPDASAVSPDG
jgi:hypothetical protein